MAFDFPSSPTTGQIYTSGGVSYQWNGYGWVVVASGTAAYLPLSGGTLTGDLTVQKSSPLITLNRTDTGPAPIVGQMNGVNRWRMDMGGGADAGSNAGSNFVLYRYADAGGNLGAALTINRVDGLGTVTADPTAALGIATKQYTDAVNTNANTRVLRAGDTMSGALTISSGALQVGLNPYVIAQGTAGGNPLFITRNNNDGYMSIGVVNAGGGTWTHQLYGNGNYVCSGTIQASGTITAAGSGLQSSNQNGLTVNGSTQSGGVNYTYVWTVAAQGGSAVYWQTATQPGVNQWTSLLLGSVSWQFYASGEAYKNGGGPWASNSDARIKNVLGNYEHGLDEILKINPVRFTYKGNDTNVPPANVAVEGLEVPKDRANDPIVVPYENSPHGGAAKNGTEYIGVIAQDIETVMPETVSMRTGYIDGMQVDDMRNFDGNALTYALVNAVKTLSARIAVLEGAGAVRRA